MKHKNLFLSAVTVFIVCSCGNVTRRADPIPSKSTLLLISLDGFRWDYPDKVPTPNLHKLIDGGVRAKSLISVFPSKTFPNHYSIVTGLYTEHHGIVSNSFYDAEWDTWFSYRDSANNQDARWWSGGEPIWITAERQNRIGATFFWPGSEVLNDGFRPHYWKHYDGKVADSSRIDTVISWIGLPEDRRPAVIACYFSVTDEVGHVFGPESKEINVAISHLDTIMGRLIDGLRNNGRFDEVNLIIVSDHGMSQTDIQKVIFLDDYIDMNSVKAQMESPVVGLKPINGDADSLIAKLTNAHPHMKVLTKENMPFRYHHTPNRRIPEVICLADEEWSITTHDWFNRKKRTFLGGAHGYDPLVPSMGGTFIAYGPAFRKGLETPSIENIHIYELMAKIMEIKPAPNDGSLDSIRYILK